MGRFLIARPIPVERKALVHHVAKVVGLHTRSWEGEIQILSVFLILWLSGVKDMRVKLFAGIARWAVAAAVSLGLVLTPGSVAYGVVERTALWRVVKDLCLPVNQMMGLALPCLKVDREREFAVVRAPGDETRIIVVPTIRIEGIESPILLRESTPNYWALAWGEREAVITAASRPLAWNDIGMAVNSRASRTQDQLHIHVDCVDARLKRALAFNASRLSNNWTAFDLRPWVGYRAKRIGVEELNKSVFQQVANEIPGARARMGLQSVAVVGFVGADGDRGFVVLAKGNGGHAEELLDHQCSRAR